MKNRLLAALLVFSATAAHGQEICRPSEQVYAMLTDQYGESRRVVGLASGSFIEIWGNLETGSFTVFETRPNGLSCAIVAGEAYSEVLEVAGEAL